MAYNTLEYLEVGNVDFVFNLTEYDYKNLINNVRKSARKNNIINGFLPKLQDSLPRFCFEIIYDLDEYVENTKHILDSYYKLDLFTKEKLELFLNNSSLGFYYLKNNFEQIINMYEKELDFVLNFIFNNFDKCFELLKILSLHPKLHIRFLFMKYMIAHNPEYIDMFYDDITKYLTSETYQENEQLSFMIEYMDVKDVSELACLYFIQNINYFTWLKFKQFILENYEYNDLAYYLTKSEHSFEESIKEFNKDSNVYFSTALSHRLYILQKYSKNISKELLEAYRQRLIYFKNSKNSKYSIYGYDRYFENLDIYGLDRNLEFYVDKYLSLSSSDTYEYLETGSTASCFRIGDYVFKLVYVKHSFESIICPDLYIILPNLEEDFIRDNNGVVTAGIEVQKYLSRSAKNVPEEIFNKYIDELYNLGYYIKDTLINGPCGDNCRLLDSFMESGNLNPPDWFKEYPLVLVDRDLVFDINNSFPKQLVMKY